MAGKRLGPALRSFLIVAVFAGWSASAAPPMHEGKVVLFGNLHAHSKLSDDISNAGNEMLPEKAFAYADSHNIDFLAITDHHKATDSPHRLWMTPDEYKTKLYDAAMQYNSSHPGQFVAIPGIEWGNTATGNHMNVFGALTLPPDTIKDAEYDDLLSWAEDNAKFVQFNHPQSWSSAGNRNKKVGNFGSALYPTPDQYVEAADPIVKTVAIICTVTGGHINGKYAESEAKTHREMQWENHYKRFLNMGRMSATTKRTTTEQTASATTRTIQPGLPQYGLHLGPSQSTTYGR